MGCPSWCTTQCWVLALVLACLILFLGSFVSPWYLWQIDDNKNDVHADYLFYWSGAEKYVVNKTHHSHETIGWSDLGDDAHHFYVASNVMAIFGFLGTWILTGCLIVGMLQTKRTNENFSAFLWGNIKWFIFGLTILLLLFSVISWMIFFGFNRKLNCADGYSDPCHKFAGSKTYRTALTGDEIKMTWGPSLGWIFALLTTPILILCMILAVFIGRNDPDRDFEVNADLEERRRIYTT